MNRTVERRRVDWRVILNGNAPSAKLANSPVASNQLAALTAEVMGSPTPENIDRLLRHAVEFARTALQIERVGIYLLDQQNNCMVGTWGTDDQGNTVDEHGLMFDSGGIDREVFDRAQAGLFWTMYEDCPHITQAGGESRVIGQGWVACTPIIGPEGPLGILFNDTAITKAPFDEAKQARAAILCSLLEKALTRSRSLTTSSTTPPVSEHALVRKVTQLLNQDPTLSCDELSKRLKISSGRLARTFKRETKASIVEYRNELRLARFLERVDGQAANLLEAALDAGFGSYAQFHRVFRARFGRTPSDYLVDPRSKVA